jgi:hypothetical protein
LCLVGISLHFVVIVVLYSFCSNEQVYILFEKSNEVKFDQTFRKNYLQL